MISFSLYMTQDFLENNVQFSKFLSIVIPKVILDSNKTRWMQNTTSIQEQQLFLRGRCSILSFISFILDFFHLSVRSHTWKTFG